MPLELNPDLFPDREFHLATNGAKLKRYLDCIDVFDVVDLSHYPELNDEVYSVLKTDIQQRGLTNVRFYDKWDYGQTDDAYQMTNVFSEKNLNKTDIFSHCSHRGGAKIVQGRIFPCCNVFGQTVRKKVPMESASVEMDVDWRQKIITVDMEPHCQKCYIDVPAPSSN